MQTRTDIRKLIEINLTEAKLFQQHYASGRAADWQLTVGDKVAINTEGLKLQGQAAKVFKQRYMGPYVVVEKLSPVTYKLRLPSALSQVHDVFHISKLRKWRDDGIYPDRYVSEALSQQAADIARGEFLVDSILEVDIAPREEMIGDVLQFKVHWSGYDSTGDTWEPYALVKNTDALERFFLTDAWQRMVTSPAYLQLWQKYRSRVPADQRPTLARPKRSQGTVMTSQEPEEVEPSQPVGFV
jgi:hypothetical protein